MNAVIECVYCITGRMVCMSLNIKREVIADGVAFSEIVDKKIKTSVLKIKFITELSEKDAPLNSMAAMLIGSSNSRIRSYSEMSDKLNALYGSSLYTDTSKSGDCQFISFTADCIDNRFALESEDILGQLLDIAHDCIFSPNVNENGFDSTEFELKRRELIESIQAEINNKRGYALLNSQKHIFKDEPCSYPQYGTVENAQKITPQEVYDAFRRLIKTAVTEIYFVSASENPSVKERFRKAFSAVERCPQTPKLRTVSPLKPEICYASDTVEMKQSKVVMAFKTSSEDRNACTVVSRMFGGTTFSRLFTNVREKMSLCYYCSAGYIYSKGTMLVDSGVEKENTEKLTAEIINQLNALKNGDFTDEELLDTKLYMINSVKSVNDSPNQIINWYFSSYCTGEMLSPEEYTERIMAVTREEVTEAAKSFEPDTVYVMEAAEGSQAEEEDFDE